MKLSPIALVPSVALAACVAQPDAADMPAAEVAAQPNAAETAAPEAPLPSHWIGAFTMVETQNVPAGREQFRLTLSVGTSNHFRAERGCYSQQGYLHYRGGEWVVQRRGGIQADGACLAAPGAYRGSPEGLFQHRAVTLSPPGAQRWIAEGNARWTYLANPAAPPARLRPPPPPPPPARPSRPGMSGGGLDAADADAVEALYRHQIAHNASGGKLNVALLCLAAGPDGDRLADPPENFLARFRGHTPPVKGYSGCRWDDVHWTDRATGGEAIVHYVTSFACPSATRCTAAGGYLEGNMSASGNRYALERTNGRWRVTSDVMEWIS